jgi:hypothetical protein
VNSNTNPPIDPVVEEYRHVESNNPPFTNHGTETYLRADEPPAGETLIESLSRR